MRQRSLFHFTLTSFFFLFKLSLRDVSGYNLMPLFDLLVADVESVTALGLVYQPLVIAYSLFQ